MPAFTKRLATENSFQTQPTALGCAILLDGFRGVVGTTRRETAMLSEKGAQNELVSANNREKNLSHD